MNNLPDIHTYTFGNERIVFTPEEASFAIDGIAIALRPSHHKSLHPLALAPDQEVDISNVAGSLFEIEVWQVNDDHIRKTRTALGGLRKVIRSHDQLLGNAERGVIRSTPVGGMILLSQWSPITSTDKYIKSARVAEIKEQPDSTVFLNGECIFDPTDKLLIAWGKKVHLRDRQSALLEYLVARFDTPVSIQELVNHVRRSAVHGKTNPASLSSVCATLSSLQNHLTAPSHTTASQSLQALTRHRGAYRASEYILHSDLALIYPQNNSKF